MLLIQSLGTSLEKSLGFNGEDWCEFRRSFGGFVVGTVGLLVATGVCGESSFLMLMKGGRSQPCLPCKTCGQGQELLVPLRRRHSDLLFGVEANMKASKTLFPDAIIH